MNTHAQTITVALASRGLIHDRFTCACCLDGPFALEEHMDGEDGESCVVSPRTRAAIVDEYGLCVCITCAEDMRLCEQTGKAFHEDYHHDAVQDDDGRWYYDADALIDSGALAADYRAGQAIYLAGY